MKGAKLGGIGVNWEGGNWRGSKTGEGAMLMKSS